MDQAHLHLVLNHFPILGSFFGAFVLSYGLIKKNRTIKRFGLLVIFLVAVATIPAYVTGEAAEHATEDLYGSSHHMLEEHEDLAKIAFPIMLVLGGFSGLIWFLSGRNEEKDYSKATWAILVSTVLMFAFMALIGNHGGKIRRPELRGEQVIVQKDHDELH